MNERSRARVVLVAALLAALALLLTAPSPTSAARLLVDAGSATDPTAPLVALLSLLAWAASVHLLAVTGLALGARLPGAAGAALRAALGRSAPAGLRRGLELALGASLAVGALAGPASAGTVPSLDHPGAPLAATAARAAATAVAPDLDRPVPAAPDLDHPAPAAPDLDHPAPAAPAAAAAPALGRPAPPREVVVAPGDTLWDLAAEDLERRRPGAAADDARVAQAWPAWWQVNRAVIGDDPDLLLPGTRLAPPAAVDPEETR